MIRKLNPISGPVCGVFAATLATHDVPFVVVKNIADKEMGKRSRWKGRMSMQALESLLSRLTVRFKRVSEEIERLTLMKAAERLDPTRHYIVFVTGHFMTLHNGQCYDQSHATGTPMSDYWCKGRSVLCAVEIDRTIPLPKYAEVFPDSDDEGDE